MERAGVCARWASALVPTLMKNVQHDLLVVADGAKNGVVQRVPLDVLNNGAVTGEDAQRIDGA